MYFQRLFAREIFQAVFTLELGLHATLVGHVPGHVLFVLVAPAAHVQAKESSFRAGLFRAGRDGGARTAVRLRTGGNCT